MKKRKPHELYSKFVVALCWSELHMNSEYWEDIGAAFFGVVFRWPCFTLCSFSLLYSCFWYCFEGSVMLDVCIMRYTLLDVCRFDLTLPLSPLMLPRQAPCEEMLFTNNKMLGE